MTRWTWIALAAAAAVGWWWWRQRKAPAPALGTAAPTMSTAGVVATLTATPRELTGRSLAPAAQLQVVGFGRTAPPALMNAPAPPAAPTAKKKLPPGSKCPAGYAARAFRAGSESWVECHPTTIATLSK